jgi:hypothetical protein
MMCRRFHRSTKTPATGPMTRAGPAAAIMAPPTASGPHGLFLAMIVAIHRTTVMLKMELPVTEMA